MGLDSNGTKFLLHAKKHGVSFALTAMIGRQTLNLEAGNLLRNLNQFGYNPSAREVEKILSESKGYAEPFFRMLGAKEIHSFDASNYEAVSHVHDFNLPLGENFKNKFSVVLDGGTLEHIFNFPVAIKNCLEMVAEGGHFLSITPTNNFLGHGFYQFSPELYFRILSLDNGYSLQQIIIFEDFIGSNWYRVADPDEVHERVTLINNKPTYLLIIAKRIKVVPLFERMPQQSDYLALWQQSNESIVSLAEAAAPQTTAANNNAASQSFIRQTVRKSVSLLRLMKFRLEQSRGAINEKNDHFKKID